MISLKSTMPGVMTSPSQEALSDIHADYSIHSLLPREINFPPYKQSAKTYYELEHHFSQTDELNAAFKEKYGPSCTNNSSLTLINSESKPLVEFMQK
jgi:hypothetical protein